MTLPEYEEFVYDACLLDWDAEEERMGRDQGALRPRRHSVHIVGAETDLTLGIEGREGVVSAGFRNMPDGEVFYSPVEDSAEGVITYAEFPAVYLGHDVVGARLVFREGRRSSRPDAEQGRRVPAARCWRWTMARAGWASLPSATTLGISSARPATSSSTRRSAGRCIWRWARTTRNVAARTSRRCALGHGL